MTATTAERSQGDRLLRVSGSSFVCGAICRGDRVVEVAPYLRAAARRAGWDGRTATSLLRSIARHGWVCEEVSRG